MRLGQYLLKNRIIDLTSNDFHGAISELVQLSSQVQEIDDEQSIAQEIIEKEQTITSYLGNGVALPYVKRDIKKPYMFFVGRSKYGLIDSEQSDHKDTKLIFLMVVSNSSEESYLSTLAAIARVFQGIDDISCLLDFPLPAFRDQLRAYFGLSKAKLITRRSASNTLMLREAKKIARVSKCQQIMVFADVLTDDISIPDEKNKIPITLVTCKGDLSNGEHMGFQHVINVHFCSSYRLSQVRSAVIIGLTRGIIKPRDKICCVTGLPKSNTLDTLSIVDVAKEFGSSFASNEELIKEGIHPEVLERLLTIAADISIEGREGKSVGCLFILGDINKIKPYIKPLVLNPFYGYKEEDRHILNPFMAETIKEFSSIDGAFIVRGDGVIESAGSLVQANNDPSIQMPSGFGTRHAAAALISSVANCIAIVVSESTNLVTIFNEGKMMLFSDQSFSSVGV